MSDAETQAPDLNSIPMADLEKMVNSTEPQIADDPLADVEAEPEPESEQTEDEQLPVEDKPEEPTPEAKPVEDEKPSEPEIPEHVRLRMEATELERKKFEALAGRHAGELGFLRNKLKELETRLQSQPSAETGYESVETTDQHEVKPQGQDRFAEWAVQQSLAQTVAAFGAQYPDANGMATEISDYLSANGIDLATIAQSRDPISTATEVRTALELAYLHVATAKKQEAATKAEQEAARRNADEVKTLSGRRKAIASTPTGGVRAAVPTKENDPRTMPLKDLSRMIERMGSGEE
jgi:hypothetical protein